MKRVYELKLREDSKAMLVLLDDVGKLASYVEVPDVAYELLEVNDKPMTIIYPNAKNLAKNLIAQDQTIGIRITSETFTKALLFTVSVNPLSRRQPTSGGEPSPRCFAEISEVVKAAVDYVVDFRQEETTNPAPPVLSNWVLVARFKSSESNNPKIEVESVPTFSIFNFQFSIVLWLLF